MLATITAPATTYSDKVSRQISELDRFASSLVVGSGLGGLVLFSINIYTAMRKMPSLGPKRKGLPAHCGEARKMIQTLFV
jgi:hypothetical protein